ncbi:MAG TPA: hypothetical protein VM369_08050 [Candidatus Binatia bacterium]|nr:hypothetical protein [Candidatus Binatia bacterium]
MHRRALLAAFLGGLLLQQSADALPRDRDPEPPRTEQGKNRRDANDGREQSRRGAQAAARKAQSMNGGGRVLAVHPEGDGFRVKLLKDGEVRIVHVPEEPD